jgi:hypothetical protein
MIGSKRGLPHMRSRSIKCSKLMDRMLWTRIRRLLHWNGNGATGTLKRFFVCINNGITTNIGRRLMRRGCSRRSLPSTTCTDSGSTGTTGIDTVVRGVGVAG